MTQNQEDPRIQEISDTTNPEDSTRNQEDEDNTDININNISMMNNLYKRYVKNPKGIDTEAGEVDLEVMLVNSLKINAGKVQEIIDSFLIEKDYISIFCLTETKVDCIDFTPVGLTTYDKQRTGKPQQEKGGGLMIGHLTNGKIKLE